VVAAALPLAALGIVLVVLGLVGWVRWIKGGGTLLGALLVGIVGVGLATWLIPRFQVASWRQAGIRDPVKLAELTNTSRTTVTQGAAGIGLILTLTLTAYQVNETRRSSEVNFESAERGQATDRFARAVEQLGATSDGAPATEIRIGGLFSLLRIGLDSEPDREAVLLVAAQYVKNNQKGGGPTSTPNPGEPCSARRNQARRKPRADVAAALRYVLPQLAREVEGDSPGLEGADFSATDLARFDLHRLRLEDVSFRNARLNGVAFGGVMLNGVDFRDACLRGAHLNDADAIGPVDLRGADIRNADLSPQVRQHAVMDGTTKR
jgi:hypothetical protein